MIKPKETEEDSNNVKTILRRQVLIDVDVRKKEQRMARKRRRIEMENKTQL